ncbi:MAG: hypothetical protein LBQ39_01925 [Tannerellaceae bacterium]|jgi:hypothetical protein|nr:hypothetical protein [Tannerellaceae bacterium]
MTEQEIRNEVMTDSVNAVHYSDAKDRKFRRMVIKASRFPVYAHSEYMSPRKNRWLIFFEARSKKETGDMTRITIVCLYNSPHGYYAVMVSFIDGRSHLIIYAPHFFSRYAERCGIELSGIELIKRFFKHNSNYVYATKETVTGENAITREIYGSTEEGVAMGFISQESNIMFRTFITYDMTKGEQVSTFAENERIRKEIHYA